MSTTARCSPECWPGSGCLDPAAVRPGPAPVEYWRRGATAAARSANTSAAVASPRPSPNAPTSRPTADVADRLGAALPRSTPAPHDRATEQAHRRRRRPTGGRPPAFDPVAYRRRNVVERCFQRLKQYRAIATRYDKTATSYQGMIDHVAALVGDPVERGRALLPTPQA